MLLEHRDVLDAGVIGVYQTDKELQHVRAYVVKKHGSKMTESDLAAWMEQESASTGHLTGGVVFVDDLPRNNVSRVQSNPSTYMKAKTLIF